jgi:hypothetical protein
MQTVVEEREDALLTKAARSLSRYQRGKKKILTARKAEEALQDERSPKRYRQETLPEGPDPYQVSGMAQEEAFVNLETIQHQDEPADGQSDDQGQPVEEDDQDKSDDQDQPVEKEPDNGEEEAADQYDEDEDEDAPEEDNNEDKVVKRLLALIKEDPSQVTEELASRFQQLRLNHHTSHDASAASWLYAWRFCQVLLELRNTDCRPKKNECRPLISYRTSRTVAHGVIPRITMRTLHRNCKTREYVLDLDMSVFPKKKYEDPATWQICYSVTEVKLRDVLDHFDDAHADMPHPLGIVLSLDGVPESKSGISMEVLSIKVEGCVRVYPLKVFRPDRKACKVLPDEWKLDIHAKMADVVQELNSFAREGRVRLRRVVADAPMRASIRMQKQHGAYYSCDYCTERATAIEISCSPKRVFPYNGRSCADARTTPQMLQLVELYESMSTTNRKKQGDQLLGVQGRSPLFEMQGFDVVNGVVAEAMHLVYMGVAKKLMQLTFKTGSGKNRATTQQRVNVEPLSDGLLHVLVPSEFPRRTKAYDAYWKASEYRNLLLAFFPLVVDCIPAERRNERTLWILLAYLTRTCIMSDEEYRTFSQAELKKHHDHFYKLFTKVFGLQHCTYNIHVFSHLQTIRQQGKLQETSAFPFEASYGILKDSYWPGTTAPGKQALARLLSRYGPQGHRCERALTYAVRVTTKQNDTIVHCKDGQFYRLIGLGDEQHPCFYGKKLYTKNYVSHPALGLAFDKVGVFMLDGDQPTTPATVIQHNDIRGKGIIVPTSAGEALISLPKDFLQECLAC